MNKQVLGTTLIAEYPRFFPSYHVCDSGVTNSSALLEGEFTRKHRRYDRFSTHTLLFSNVLDREPADRVFFSLCSGHGPPLG